MATEPTLSDEQQSHNVARVWDRRAELPTWHQGVRTVREYDDPRHPHEAAEYAFRLACSLSKYVATPWAIDLTPSDVITFSGMILDPKVPA